MIEVKKDWGRKVRGEGKKIVPKLGTPWALNLLSLKPHQLAC
jgi:hypothetical protein